MSNRYYDEGYKAYQLGMDKNAPYPRKTVERKEWLKGYTEANKEHKTKLGKK